VTFTTIQARRIEYTRWGSSRPAPPLVLLHEGLGSVSMWRDFPSVLSAVSGHPVLAYSRVGHGRSEALRGPRKPSFMHDEALVALPALLDALDVQAPVLVGHSDGGSIALIHAASSGRAVAGLVVIAPHVKVEACSLQAIRAAREAYASTGLRDRLARHHDQVDSAFRGWNDVWLDPAFRSWNIETLLPRIACPILAIQGEQDEYGTMEQIDSIARGAHDVRLLKLADCGHSPHRDQRDTVLAAIDRFVAELSTS
jgi:pimeloyl-ACP methyl ester carboxylesterase